MKPSARALAPIGIAAIAFSLGLFIGHAAPAEADTLDGRLVVQNVYYPKSGMEDEVLATRLEASAVRRELGLAAGRVLRRIDGPDDAPYVMWEAEYESQAGRERDVAALDGTDFEKVADHMGTLLDHFGRTVWEVVDER